MAQSGLWTIEEGIREIREIYWLGKKDLEVGQILISSWDTFQGQQKYGSIFVQ